MMKMLIFKVHCGFNKYCTICLIRDDMSHNMTKPVFKGLPITKAQTSLRIGVDWSAPFIIRLLEITCIISKLATSKFSSFKLVSVAEQTGLSLPFSETPKTGFVATRPIWGSMRENPVFDVFKQSTQLHRLAI